MGQGHIRKGFFFYFGLFVLLLITIFLVCLVVMIFNPGSTVLWMQYFTSNQTILVTKTTDDSNQTIDWSDVESIEITCTYADVTVERNSRDDYTTDGIYIVNYAKGFTAASSAVEFNYEVYLQGSVLKVEITEPTGFLYFSKEIEIVLYSTTRNNNSNFMDGINIIINTTDGDVRLGGSNSTDDSLTSAKSFEVTTGKGSISITDNLDTSTLSSLSLTTGSGDIKSYKTVTLNGTSTTGISFGGDLTLATSSGNINLNALIVPSKEIVITCESGNISIGYVSADTIKFQMCVGGNYVFGTVNADVNFADSTDSLVSPNILINTINGNFTLSTDSELNGSPDIEIGTISEYLSVNSNKGSLKVESASGAVEIYSGNNMSVDIVIASGNNETISITNTSGSVRVGFVGTVSTGGITIKNNSGSITIDVTSIAEFTANMYTRSSYEGSSQEYISDSNIILNLGDLTPEGLKNPLNIGSGSSRIINIATNSTVTFNLVTAV